jgi:hypothetical protein
MMALTTRPGETDREPIDDYRVEPHAGELTQPVSHHILAAVNAVLLIILAAVSFALFWIVATLLGVV